MLWIVDTVQAAPNTIYVQPAAGAIPEWVKILISAGVGAIFGICGNIAMEFVRPAIAKFLLRRSILRELVRELQGNLATMQDVAWILDRGRDQKRPYRSVAVDVVSNAVAAIDDGLYLKNLENHKALVYEIDSVGELKGFYKAARESMPQLESPDKIAEMIIVAKSIIGYGERFLSSKRIQRRQGTTPVRAVYENENCKLDELLYGVPYVPDQN
jgi:hypothetical protein